MSTPIIVAIDIDDTIIPHTYPNFDPATILPGCLQALQAVCQMSDRVGVVLCSMRHTNYYRGNPSPPRGNQQPRKLEPVFRPTRNGDTITPVAEYLKANSVRILGINEAPGQWRWTNSPKAYYHVLIDDRNIGIPLTDEGCVDWAVVGPMLKQRVRVLLAPSLAT